MNSSSWFDNQPVIGKLSPEQAAAKLREVGEDEAASRLESMGTGLESTGQQQFRGESSRRVWWPFQDKPWQYTAHTFGYLAPNVSNSDPMPIRHIESIAAHPDLRGKRIKLTLNRLRIAGYPGSGIHRVLLHFYVQHQGTGKAEPLHFNATYRVHEGESAGVQGYPVFTGLNVGYEGLSLKCRTINVRNDADEAFLSFLESDTFKTGLHLVKTAQPVLAPFSEMALALAKNIGKRNRNVAVQDFDLGLDFSTTPLQGKLAEGAYIAVQIPESFKSIWDWDEWVYLPTKGIIVKHDDQQELIPYNYLVFGVSRYEEH
ncbi:MAG TPA: hypothetical protein DHW02_09915 [Ktedonobacter sp.]|nr:hypothetical protein [Ktedonobacter sp.]